MKRTLVLLCSLFLLAGLLPFSGPVFAQSARPFTPEELEDLLAPIALYPDPLLAQILPASTFVEQLVDAARFVRRFGVIPAIDGQPWDVSVKALAHYPNVLFMMERDLDWTVALGQAFIDQESQVMNAIQRLRAEALAQGNLVSTPQQQVIVEGGYIRIVPAQPNVIFVPRYDPQLVYLEPPPPTSVFIFFGSGFLIGAWLNRDFNWSRHRIFYHGWQGGGWVGRARRHVRRRDNYYIHHRFGEIRRNRRILRRDIRPFRERIRRDAKIRHERRLERERIFGRPAPKPPGRSIAPVRKRPTVPAVKRPVVPRERRPTVPTRKRPERVRPASPAPSSPSPSKRRMRDRDRNPKTNRPSSRRENRGSPTPRGTVHSPEREGRRLDNRHRRSRIAPRPRTAPARPATIRRRPAKKPAARHPEPRRERRDRQKRQDRRQQREQNDRNGLQKQP